MEKRYIEFLRFCLNENAAQPEVIEKMDWAGLFRFCQEQAIAGVVFEWLKVHGEGLKIPKEVLLQWFALSEQIKQRNIFVNKHCYDLQDMFAEAGFDTCILKGQGNALLYDVSCRKEEGRCLALARTPGDIDIWVRPKADGRGEKVGIRRIIEFLNTKCDIQKQVIGYHHVELPIFNDVEVEVHWRPSWRSSPLHNKRMQKWFNEQADSQFNHIDEKSGMHVPTLEFNVIYLLQHMFLHIFQEGLGLRQVMDYYFVLANEKLIDNSEKLKIMETLQYLGLWKFAGAVMYVMQEVFALEKQFMIAPMDEKRGAFLLEEIMRSGNFGRYDNRNRDLSQKTGISRSLARLKRQYRYLRDYPVEVLCAPFQIYHVIWRKMKLWKWE